AGLTVDTPAAAAAIRGTDWTLTVDGDGRTSLIVLEGLVELSNEFGSVSVAQGEAAAASIGQAPTKLVIVAPKDREQMLFFLSVRNAFHALPASPLSSSKMRRERGRIEAIPEMRRTPEDWVALAEAQFSYDGRQKAAGTAAIARALPLSAGQSARLDLIDAMIAGAERRYDEAAALFGRAAPWLDERRRAIAAYGGYFARALADPNRIEQPPSASGAGPYAALAAALTAGFLDDIPAAVALLGRAEHRYPDDPTLPAARAQLSILIDDRAQAEEAIDRSLALDPDDPTALEARSLYRAGYKGDIEGAYADIARAADIAPGSTTIWNQLGNIQSVRGAEREAEAAFLRSIELDPQDPASRANLAIFYLDQGRLAEAKAEIDRALEVDPAFEVALIARGRYYLQTGELDRARNDLLAGTTANPAHSQGLLLLAAGYYESGEHDAADQAIDNADRLDPNDPVTSSFKTAIAIDEYQADEAIANAQEALRRTRARGGDYAALSASRDAGSTLNDAFRLLNLNAWGRYYGDAVFDPFAGAGYVDQALAGSVNPFVNNLRFGEVPTEPGANTTSFSSFFQGLMFDPQMLSGRSRSVNLLRRPFIEASVGGGFVADDGNPGWTSEIEVQGYQADPVPWSFYGRIAGLETDTLRGGDPVSGQFDLEDRSITGTGYVAMKPTPYDRVVAYVDVKDFEFGLDAIVPPVLTPFLGPKLQNYGDTRTGNAGVAWSHTFGYRNVASAAVFATAIGDESVNEQAFVLGGLPVTLRTDVESEQQSYLGAVNHTFGTGDFTFRYGGEGGMLDVSRDETLTFASPFFPDTIVSDTTNAVDVAIGRVYFDTVYEFNPNLKLEGALFGTFLDGGAIDEQRLEPRFGVAWTPFEGHFLRAGFLREGSFITSATLAPVGLLGLQSNQSSLATDGFSDTFAARWDAEWNGRLFTAIDYQHQEFDKLSIGVPASATTIDLSEGRLDRVSATANVWIGGGFGAFATFAYADSENEDSTSPGFGEPLPFVPETSSRFGLTWVHPSNVKVTLAGTYVGSRTGDAARTELKPYWSTDAFLTWEPFDKRFALDIAAYNLLDEEFEVATGTPGWGRSIVGSLKVRF
ncbi:MAG: tetratricopeptide repeat protein, partial [Pseudaminobacter sp.]|nr:tetratricopeptide repeat protein [Pseudaminobacter sp.]